ncbi:MAG TPA: PBP1A family penicillin-binding protein [Bacillota bacterium]|jgi:1A family penicillin-binding protein|nr:PBP1A family penicillin-binding protein [Bacillota bacterium]HOB86494.1 PBP1A family penicillin-binding protein [Bacillota bacterium]HPZ64100.1 PBP1A family penicillin-binding protein [Bacillota bacterium]HQD05206.1 PBP1A family penicillin-binding protein [Bacillota bacterium]
MKPVRFLLIALAVLLLSISASFGYFVYSIVEMESLPPVQTPLASQIYDQNDNLLALRYIENRVEVPLEQVADTVVKATIAVEDRRFFQHMGFDLSGLGRAFFKNIRQGQVTQGGSTITQQLAKNLYLTHERTFQRKIKEAIYTVHLERSYTKEKILEMYLNTIYYGNSAYGIEAAAQTYFDKSAAELNLAESALLAGIPRNPSYYSPFVNKEAALARQKTVLALMHKEGYISRQEMEEAAAATLEFCEPSQEEDYCAYFVDYIINGEIKERLGGDLTPLYRDGLKIYTTLDPQLQKAAQEIVAQIPELRRDQENKRQPQGALVALDPATGYVKALVGGRDFQETKLNRAVTPRSPGSSFKPFLYAAALEEGCTAADLIMCEPVSFTEPGLDQPYRPADYGGGWHHRRLSLREALVTSCNVSAVKTHVEIGTEKMVEMAKRLGITSELEPYLSLPLGTVEVGLLELTAAFAPFANGGYRVEPILVRKVTDAQGNILWENQPRPRQVLDERIAFLITDILKGVLTQGGTASGAGEILKRPAAGKSGTSHDSKNAHMIGYTPDLVAGIYIGDDYENPLGATGGRLAAPLWAEFMSRAHRGLPSRDFAVPQGLVRVTVCTNTGLRQNSYCSGAGREEYFLAGTEPQETCNPWRSPECRPSFWIPWFPWESWINRFQ